MTPRSCSTALLITFIILTFSTNHTLASLPSNFLQKNSPDNNETILHLESYKFPRKPAKIKQFIDDYFPRTHTPQNDSFVTHSFCLFIKGSTKKSGTTAWELAHLLAQEAMPVIAPFALISEAIAKETTLEKTIGDPTRWCVKQISKQWALLIPHPSPELQNSTTITEQPDATPLEKSIGFFVDHLALIPQETLKKHLETSGETKGNTLLKELIVTMRNHTLIVPRTAYQASKSETSAPTPTWAAYLCGHSTASQKKPSGKKKIKPGQPLSASMRLWINFLNHFCTQNLVKVLVIRSCFDYFHTKVIKHKLVQQPTYLISTSFGHNTTHFLKAPLFPHFLAELLKKNPDITKALSFVTSSPFEKGSVLALPQVLAQQIPYCHTTIEKPKHPLYRLCLTAENEQKIAWCTKKGGAFTIVPAKSGLPLLILICSNSIKQITLTTPENGPALINWQQKTPAISSWKTFSGPITIEKLAAPYLTTEELVKGFLYPLVQRGNEEAIIVKNLETKDNQESTLYLLKTDNKACRAFVYDKKAEKACEWRLQFPGNREKLLTTTTIAPNAIKGQIKGCLKEIEAIQQLYA